MHDPRVVAFQICRPWPFYVVSKLDGRHWYPPMFTIWHVDPRKGGDERSCGRWFVEGRPWWRHPRWHIWHWRIQWHFGQALHRYLFSRCAGCGKPFAWNEAPTSGWNTPRSSLFRGEQGVYHGACFGKSGAYKRA